MKQRNRFTTIGALSVAALLLTSCGKDNAPRTSLTPIDVSAASVPGMAHGNHIPKYGGVVLMNGDLHIEIVANESGSYTVYFSDAARRELPASVVQNARLSIQRPGFRGEPVQLKISDNGEYWEGKGGFVDDRDTNLQIYFDFQGQQKTSDMPFFAGEAMKNNK